MEARRRSGYVISDGELRGRLDECIGDFVSIQIHHSREERLSFTYTPIDFESLAGAREFDESYTPTYYFATTAGGVHV